MFTKAETIKNNLSLHTKSLRSIAFKFRGRLEGKGAITISSVLTNAIIMQAGYKKGRLKLNNNF